MSAGRRNEALDKYKSCVKGTEEMARVVCAAVEKEFGKDGKLGVGKKWGVGRVKCVFSPYEADAQLAKLCADGYCHGVVTEVSEVWGGCFDFIALMLVSLYSIQLTTSWFVGFGCTCVLCSLP